MAEYLIPLSWPHADVQSNSRKHWRVKSAKVKAYRQEANWSCKKYGVVCSPDAELIFTFTPPDNRRRDLHNMPHAMKAVIDGIADAMGCDDAKFRVTWPHEFLPASQPGCALVHIKPRTVILPVKGSIS